jgi:hypothetical protein
MGYESERLRATRELAYAMNIAIIANDHLGMCLTRRSHVLVTAYPPQPRDEAPNTGSIRGRRLMKGHETTTTSSIQRLMIASNPATSPIAGWSIGFWWEELTHPWLAYIGAKYGVDVFSLGFKNQRPKIDPFGRSAKNHPQNSSIGTGISHQSDVLANIKATLKLNQWSV